MAYKQCCIDKLHKYIYIDKKHEYTYVRCCNYTYYMIPHRINELSFVLTREKDEDEYIFITPKKDVIPLIKITDIKDIEKRDILLYSEIMKLSVEEVGNVEV